MSYPTQEEIDAQVMQIAKSSANLQEMCRERLIGVVGERYPAARSIDLWLEEDGHMSWFFVAGIYASEEPDPTGNLLDPRDEDDFGELLNEVAADVPTEYDLAGCNQWLIIIPTEETP